MLYIVTSQGSFVDSATVSWDQIFYDEATGVSTGSFRIPKTPAMIPEAHVVVAFTAANGFLTAREVTLQLDTPEDLALMQSKPVRVETEPSIPRSSARWDHRFNLLESRLEPEQQPQMMPLSSPR